MIPSAEEYVAQWPHHCKECGGQGSFVHYEDHGMGIGYEEIWEACDNCIAWTFCPRCGMSQYEETWKHWVLLFEYAFDRVYVVVLNSPKAPGWLRWTFGRVSKIGGWFGRFIPDMDEAFFEDILHECVNCKWIDGTPGMPIGPDPEEVAF